MHTARITPEEVVKAYQSLGLKCIVPMTFWRSRHGDGRVTDASVIGVLYLREFPLERTFRYPNTRKFIEWSEQRYGRDYRIGVLIGFNSTVESTNVSDRQQQGHQDGMAIRCAVDAANIPVCSIGQGFSSGNPSDATKESGDDDGEKATDKG